MASVINRTTFQFLRSADTPRYPEPTWKKNPDMTQVAGLAKYLWKWDVGTDRPIPQTAGEQTATLTARETATRDSTANQLDGSEAILRAVMNLVVDEFNRHTVKLNAVMDAVDAATSLGDFKSAVAAIADQPTRTLEQFKTAIRNNLGS